MSEDLIEEKFKTHEKQLEEHEERLDALEKTYVIMEKMDLRMGIIEKAVAGINTKLDRQESEKGSKWDKLIDYLFYFGVGAILTYLLVKVGLK